MKSTKIVIWNATKGVLRVGENKVVIKPAQRLEVEASEDVLALIAAKELVVISTREEVAEVIDEPKAEQPKKKKKEVAQETEAPVEEEQTNQEQSTTESIESPEDSILADEAF